jgi:hypothetical protein
LGAVVKYTTQELWKTAKFSTEVELKQQFSYLTEPSAQALQQARIDVEKAYSNFKFINWKKKR